MKSINKYQLAFYVLILFYIIYALLYIYKSSFIVAGERYFVLFDDAMVSMRYARNLAQGYGLVWNPGGERVEGYTNPLWVLFMAVFHLLPIPPAKISLLVQLSGAAFLVANLFVVKKIAEKLTADPFVALLAVAFTAFYAPLNNWGLLGTEVSLLTLITSLAVWLGLQALHLKKTSPWLFVLLGFSTLIRMDMAIPYLVVLGFLLLANPLERKKNLIWGLGLLAVALAGQTLFRWLYYGDLLPNTYYLKMAGYPALLRMARGLYVLFMFSWNFNWIIFLLPLTILLFRRDRSVVFMFLVFLGQLAYSIYVGGDAWEHKGGSNRYIAIAMPVFFTLLSFALCLLRDFLVKHLKPGSKRAEIAANIGLVSIATIMLINMNFLGDFKSLGKWLLLQTPDYVRGNEEYVKIALDVQKATAPEAKIAVVSAGAIPYFADRYAIDLLGKGDAIIANLKARNTDAISNMELFRPGHMKWDYDYSIGKLRPDAIVQLWAKEDALPYLMTEYKTGKSDHGYTFYLLADSPNIQWEEIEVLP